MQGFIYKKNGQGGGQNNTYWGLGACSPIQGSIGLTFWGEASVSQFMSAVQDMPIVSYIHGILNVYKTHALQ